MKRIVLTYLMVSWAIVFVISKPDTTIISLNDPNGLFKDDLLAKIEVSTDRRISYCYPKKNGEVYIAREFDFYMSIAFYKLELVFESGEKITLNTHLKKGYVERIDIILGHAKNSTGHFVSNPDDSLPIIDGPLGNHNHQLVFHYKKIEPLTTQKNGIRLYFGCNPWVSVNSFYWKNSPSIEYMGNSGKTNDSEFYRESKRTLLSLDATGSMLKNQKEAILIPSNFELDFIDVNKSTTYR